MSGLVVRVCGGWRVEGANEWLGGEGVWRVVRVWRVEGANEWLGGEGV